ncbi:hypothetical protein H6P81_012417 [Aristolochia fimbriata]|uniref:Uncharacterized protein n=1 Tax=Aristolochia fimbriata TaxID=158543 RepID=A0AAV7EDB9_ARIFI|nr:hypothetical protein H6P81_012417 [Aristolochia fimbriata]
MPNPTLRLRWTLEGTFPMEVIFCQIKSRCKRSELCDFNRAFVLLQENKHKLTRRCFVGEREYKSSSTITGRLSGGCRAGQPNRLCVGRAVSVPFWDYTESFVPPLVDTQNQGHVLLKNDEKRGVGVDSWGVMGIGGSKPESSDGGVVQAGLLPVRRKIEEIRRRRKLQHRDSIVSTTELLNTDDTSSAASPGDCGVPEKVDAGATDGTEAAKDVKDAKEAPELFKVPETDTESDDSEISKHPPRRDSDEESTLRISVAKRDVGAPDRDRCYADMPKSPSFRHFAEIDTQFESDESGIDDHHQGKGSEEEKSQTAAAAAAKKQQIKKKKGRKLSSFTRGPAVCGLLHVQSCYSVPQDSPRSSKPGGDQSHERRKSIEKPA